MNYLREFIALQNDLNVLINGKDWESKKIDWYTALVGECCELIKEVRGDHWRDLEKKGCNKDIIGELADVLHFLVAAASSKGLSQKAIESLLLDSELCGNRTKDIVKSIHGIHQQEGSSFAYFNSTVDLLGIDKQTIFKHTLGKCVLNKFRQDHGYKEGKYRKIWDDTKDSEVVYNMVESYQGDEDFDGDKLYAQLSNDYEFTNTFI